MSDAVNIEELTIEQLFDAIESEAVAFKVTGMTTKFRLSLQLLSNVCSQVMGLLQQKSVRNTNGGEASQCQQTNLHTCCCDRCQ